MRESPRERQEPRTGWGAPGKKSPRLKLQTSAERKPRPAELKPKAAELKPKIAELKPQMVELKLKTAELKAERC